MQNKIKGIIKKLTRFGYDVKPANSKHVDPVCNMEATSNLFKVSYKGRDYYFCSSHCQDEFKAKSEEYIKSHE